jgi:hypothetical protein
MIICNITKIDKKKKPTLRSGFLFKRFFASYFPKNISTLSLILSANRYITGTITKVRNVAKVRPKITVQAIGPQNRALSPPKKICGLSSVKRV